MTRNVVSQMLMLTAMFALVGTAVRAEDRDSKLTKTEQLLVKAQKICPVSGEELESMSPIKAKVGQRTIFLCCKGCLRRQIQKEYWTHMQANLIAAQGKCPVTKKTLPKDPKATVVKGRVVFVCCPPCAKKIQADPDGYLAIVDRYLKENLQIGSERE